MGTSVRQLLTISFILILLSYLYLISSRFELDPKSTDESLQHLPEPSIYLKKRSAHLHEMCQQKTQTLDQIYCSKDPNKRSLSDKSLKHNMYGNVQINCRDGNYQYPTHSLEQMFYNDQFKIIACVPTKCGTSTWQQTLNSLSTIYEEKFENETINFNVAKKPKDFKGMDIFKSSQRLSHVSYAEAVDKLNNPNYTKVIHVRNPLSRLYSAWRQKFRKGHSTLPFFEKKYASKINELFGQEETETHIVTFNNFIKYVAQVKQDRRFDVHWNTFQYYCAPCIVDYEIISSTETQDMDMKFIMQEKMRHQVNRSGDSDFVSDLKHQAVKNLTAWDYLSKFVPKQYGDSPMKQYSVEELYKHVDATAISEIENIYYWDFQLFGYDFL